MRGPLRTRPLATGTLATRPLATRPLRTTPGAALPLGAGSVTLGTISGTLTVLSAGSMQPGAMLVRAPRPVMVRLHRAGSIPHLRLPGLVSLRAGALRSCVPVLTLRPLRTALWPLRTALRSSLLGALLALAPTLIGHGSSGQRETPPSYHALAALSGPFQSL